MSTTVNDLQRWFLRGVKEKATHMFVACDTYDWEDYPEYFTGTADEARTYEFSLNRNMQKVMEVYNLKLPVDIQLNEHRSFNY